MKWAWQINRNSFFQLKRDEKAPERCSHVNSQLLLPTHHRNRFLPFRADAKTCFDRLGEINPVK